MISQDSHITNSTLDTLMQDTWLLALAVRNGQSITVDDALYQRCFNMIQQVQEQLSSAGATASLCEDIKFAHCVFLDELIMTIPEADISAWWRRTPLQGHFLGHLNGGEHFYERIKQLPIEPAGVKAAVKLDMPMKEQAQFVAVVDLFRQPDRERGTWKQVLSREELDPDSQRAIEVKDNILNLELLK